MSTLVIAECDLHGLKSSTYQTITAALQLDAEIHVLVLGDDCDAAGDAAMRIENIAKVIHVTGAALGQLTAEYVAAQVIALAETNSYAYVMTAASSFGKNFMPRVAAKLDVAQISDVVAMESSDTFTRPIYAGNALITVKSRDAIKVITVRATAFASAPHGGDGATIERRNGVGVVARSRVISQEVAKSERPELVGARVVVSGGRGLASGQNFKMLEALADKLNAALGASRAAVDAGYVSNEHQVGQTGKIVAPDLYIAVGISGAIQHLAGMKESKVIVAINKDPDAPIFQIADYGLVGDLFEIVPELTAALK